MQRPENAPATLRNSQKRLSMYDVLAVAAAIACILTLVDGAVPQLQMFVLGGHMPVSNIIAKFVLFASVIVGILLQPKIRYHGLPMAAWLGCVGFLILDIAHLVLTCEMTLADVLQSYNAYYLLILIAFIMPFRGAVAERIVTRGIILLFGVSALIGFIQYVTARPVLYLESAEGNFQVMSWDFFDRIRAFGLFTNPLAFGLFCSLTGALGIAQAREQRVRGITLTLVSTVACYTTLTRTCYVVYMCAASYAAVLTFGKSSKRGLWQPLVYFGLGIAVILQGMKSLGVEYSDDLKNSASLMDRFVEWFYYTREFLRAIPSKQALGLGIVQNDKVANAAPVPIDNLTLVITMHIGIAGLIVFGTLLVKMWLSLRRAAIAERQPFLIAAASMWATLACSGIFNGLLAPFGAIFALAMLCQRKAMTAGFIAQAPQ